jgi:hypothetical protein
MNAITVHPPLYTKLMGRQKNKRKNPEEKEKDCVKLITKAGMTMHCSVCGNLNHKKKDMPSGCWSKG